MANASRSKQRSKNSSIKDSQTSAQPTAHSRSEIENALVGRTKVSPKKARQAASDDFDLSVSPRRQQVIGGTLSGVSNKPKFGIFSRYSDMSISNWVAAAIVGLIVLAFFWPTNKPSTLETVTPEQAQQAKFGETDLSINEQKELIESESINSELSFSRENDLKRAGSYRSQDAEDLQIRSLLDQAKQHISNGELLKPSDANALLSYRSVLAINPSNPSAREGVDYLKSRFLEAGNSALEKDEVKVAESALAGLNQINSRSDEALDLKEAINAWKTSETVSELLGQANASLEKEALILPARGNALYFYQQILNIAPDNEDALKGVKKIADTFIGKANRSIVKGDFQAASAHLATVSVIDSSHESIPLIEELIQRTQALTETPIAPEPKDNSSGNEVANSTPPSNSENTAQSNSIEEEPAPSSPKTQPVSSQTNEQQTFDKQYLKQGLEAYYRGEYGVAAALLQPLADKGIARAQLRLAYMHFLGRGYAKNRTTADSMVRAALPAIQRFADDGRAWAQSDLGSLYEDGLVLPRDYQDAFKWYELAANQGYPGAQTNLGMMYARGRGTEASRKTAIEWFQRAANQGDDVAKRNLNALGISQ